MIKEVAFNRGTVYKKLSDWPYMVGDTYKSRDSHSLVLIVAEGCVFLSKGATFIVMPVKTLLDDYTPCDVTITVS